MFGKLALLVGVSVLLEGSAMAYCTPGYAGSGYYQTRDCGLRLLSRGSSYSYGLAYGLDALNPFFLPTLNPLPLSYGHYGGFSQVPSWYAAPWSFESYQPGRGAIHHFGSSPRFYTSMRPRQLAPLPGPGRSRGAASSFGGRGRIVQSRTGVWLNK